MYKIQCRAVIKYFVLKGLKHQRKKRVGFYSERFFTIIFNSEKRAAEFKHGRSSINDDEHSRRPKTAMTEEIIEKIHNAVLNDRRVRELADIINISVNRVHNILHEHLHMKKLSARWGFHRIC